jgi:hypothetical protein
MWRGRVEALTRAQAIIEAERPAVVKEEQRRVAAAAAAAAVEEERKKKEAEAEEQRKAAEAQAAEEARLMNELVAAMAAQNAEEKAQGEAQRLVDENLVHQALGFPEEAPLGCPDNSMLKDWDLFAGVTATQQQGQQETMAENASAPAIAPTAVSSEKTNLLKFQTGPGDV